MSVDALLALLAAIIFSVVLILFLDYLGRKTEDRLRDAFSKYVEHKRGKHEPEESKEDPKNGKRSNKGTGSQSNQGPE